MRGLRHQLGHGIHSFNRTELTIMGFLQQSAFLHRFTEIPYAFPFTASCEDRRSRYGPVLTTSTSKTNLMEFLPA